MNKQIPPKDLITAVLLSFKITTYDFEEIKGTSVTLYKFRPQIGVRVSRILGLKNELAATLGVPSVRIIAPMEDGCVGIEVPNRERDIVHLDTCLESETYKQTTMALPCCLGLTVTNEVFIADLAEMPHLLVAGATGQGKSVGLNVMLMSLLYKKTPEELKLVLIDPKKVELSAYAAIARPYITQMQGMPPVITEAAHALTMLDALCRLMDKRYTMLNEVGARNIREYNEISGKPMEYYVIVIDEFADIMITSRNNKALLEEYICRLAQKARAVGMHLVISTQRPSTEFVTGCVKANFATRIAFRTTTSIDSRVILGASGAEKLTGRGDMLFAMGADITRVQCAYISTQEVISRCNEIGETHADCRPKVLRVLQEQQPTMEDDMDYIRKHILKNKMPFTNWNPTQNI